MPSSYIQKGSISRELFLGVDGGGTKTQTILCGADGQILSDDRAGPSNPLRTGVSQAVANVSDSVARVCDQVGRTPEDVVSAVVGLAGARRSDLKRQMRTGIRKLLRHARIEIVTDAEIALFATTGGEPGVVVISGTGSVCFGSNEKGKTAVAGGWGPIAGDEGGGVSIAREALRAVAQASDGRGGTTVLSGLAAEYFRAHTAEDLIVAIYSPSTDYRKLAGFARYVIDAARAKDVVALGILKEAGEDLGKTACAVIKRLKLQKKKVPVGMVGGIFAAGDLIRKPLLATVRKCAPEAFLLEPEISPAAAAARMAIAAYHQSPSR